MAKKAIDILIIPAAANVDKIQSKFKMAVKITKASYEDINVITANNSTKILYKNKDIKNFDLVWVSSVWSSRDLGFAVKKYLEFHDVSCTQVEKGTSKISDHILFSINGLPRPNTLYINKSRLSRSTNLIEKTCGYPLIIKDSKGSCGKNTFFIQNKTEFLSVIKTLPNNKKFLIEEFIPNDYDWGVMVSRGKVVAGEKSYGATGEYRNNACNGANEVFTPIEKIPQNIKDIAVKASKCLKLKWCRVDIIIDKKTRAPYVLEVNRFPGITAGSPEVKGAYKFLKMHVENFISNNE